MLPAFLLAAVPAVLAGLAYAMLASAMPRAGGSYVYASRGLSPYLGFVASFSQWFSLSRRDRRGVVRARRRSCATSRRAAAGTARRRRSTPDAVRLAISLGVLWAAAGVNLRGVTAYERLIVPLMFLTFVLGAVVIVAGFSLRPRRLRRGAAGARRTRRSPPLEASPAAWTVLLPASALLFASFIGFDSIAQAGGEAQQPGPRPAAGDRSSRSARSALFYLLFTAAVYHAVPWAYIAGEAQRRDLTAPGLLGYLLPPFWTVVIVSARRWR